jgi:hypothetical protein
MDGRRDPPPASGSTPEQVYAALTYFYDHYVEIVAAMQASAEFAESERLKQSLSRAELLKRRPAEKA